MSKTRITTVVGTAIFPHLNKPNTKFNTSGVYETGLRLTSAEAEKLVAEINAATEAEIKEQAVLNKFNLSTVKKAEKPWKQATDKNKTPISGFVDFKFKQSKVCGTGDRAWEFTPSIFDAAAQEWDITKSIWSGSKLKVCFTPNVYFVRGELGINLRLVGVQVIELVSNQKTADTMGFAPEIAPIDPASEYIPEKEFMAQMKNM